MNTLANPMNRFDNLLLSGVGPQAWRGLAEQLAQGAGGLATVVAALPAAVGARTGLLLLLVSPGEAVAQALAADPAADTAPMLAQWCQQAQEALRVLQQRPAGVALLPVHEARQDPAAAVRALAAHFGLPWQPPAAGVPAAPAADDALRQVLGQWAVGLNRRTQRLYEELLACCLPLDAAVRDAAPTALLAAASQQLARLEAEGARAGDLTARLESASRRMAQLQAAQQQAEDLAHRLEAAGRRVAELQSVEAQAKELAARLEAAGRQAAQLKKAQDEVSAQTRRRAAAEAETKALTQQLADARADAHAALRQLHLQQAEFESLQRQHAETSQRTEREQSLLVTQVHQLQEELERYYLDNERLQAEPRGGVALAWRVKALAAGESVEQAPHRGLDVALLQVELGQRTWPSLAVRLVEHHGRAGLVLFATPGDPPPLQVWRPTGTEGERSFVLLIPTDAEGAARLDELSGTDWLFVQALAERLARLTAERGAALAPRWAAVAARLRLELAGLPVAWRFDTFSVMAQPELASTFDLCFGGVQVGGRALGDVQLRWEPGRAGQPGWLEWLLPVTGAAPLAGWPLDDNALALPCWRLPFDPTLPPSQRRAQWARLGAADREVVAALLTRLPQALGAAPAQDADTARLAAPAETLVRAMRRATAEPGWKLIARVLLGRRADQSVSTGPR